MRKPAILTAVGLTAAALVSTPALANQCPKQIAALDDMLSQHGSMLSADQLAKVRQLRAKAEADHKAGRHKEAMEDVSQAHQAMGM